VIVELPVVRADRATADPNTPFVPPASALRPSLSVIAIWPSFGFGPWSYQLTRI
jgi:hypothetical protein